MWKLSSRRQRSAHMQNLFTGGPSNSTEQPKGIASHSVPNWPIACNHYPAHIPSSKNINRSI